MSASSSLRSPISLSRLPVSVGPITVSLAPDSRSTFSIAVFMKTPSPGVPPALDGSTAEAGGFAKRISRGFSIWR